MAMTQPPLIIPFTDLNGLNYGMERLFDSFVPRDDHDDRTRFVRV